MPAVLAALVLLVALTASAQTTQLPSEQPQPGGTITGIVTNDDGDPIEEASLCTTYRNATGSGTSCGLAQSGKDGKFELHVPLGEIGVFAQKQQGGYWPVVDTGPHAKGIRKVTLTSGSPIATVNLKIGPKPSELKFNVKDKSTGRPIEGFRVRWIAMDDVNIPADTSPCIRRGAATRRGAGTRREEVKLTDLKGSTQWTML